MVAGLIAFFVVVAFGGALIAMREWHGRRLPLPVGALHGLAAIAAIVLLLIHDAHAPHNLLINSATVLFLLTATGGLLLFMFRAIRQPLPGFVLILHAGFAIASIVLLSIGYLGS